MSQPENTNQLETMLDSAMRTVRPPDDVMQRLRDKIGSLEPNIIAKRITNWELSLILVGSVMAAATVIVAIARALFYLFGRNRNIA